MVAGERVACVRRRSAAALGLGLGVALAAVAHAAYWYLPRERAGRPSSEASALLADERWPQTLWVPFPHQNLGRLERRVGDLRRRLELWSSAGGNPPELPSFGPFVLPPARELVVAHAGGKRALQVELSVYPLVRLVARSAGAIAGNPWLAGGEIRSRTGEGGRVEWRRGRWIYRTTSVPREAVQEARDPGPADRRGASLALLRLRRPAGPLPPESYRLERLRGGLELRAGDPPSGPLPAFAGKGPPPFAWRIVVRDTGVSALFLWERESLENPFPASLGLRRGAARRPRLPGEELFRLAGRSVERFEAAGFELRGLGSGLVERGGTIAEELDAWLTGPARLRFDAGAEPAPLAAASAGIARRFRGLPLGRLAGYDPELLAALLAPWEDCGRSRLTVWGNPDRVRWQLCTQPEESL
jgi:hypothetical protein